jgi:hypothetical protein
MALGLQDGSGNGFGEWEQDLLNLGYPSALISEKLET